jgi:hypothetical protein
MKTYQAPVIVAKGDVVSLTQGPFVGRDDPNGTTIASAVGSVGHNL